MYTKLWCTLSFILFGKLKYTLYTRYPIVARALGLAECVARAKVSCIQKYTELCRYHKISIKLSLYGEFNGVCVIQFVRLATTRGTRPYALVPSSTAVYEVRLTTA